jgi:hypothetical protein
LLYCVTAVGGTAAALSVHDTLFPTLGGSNEAGPLTGVWQNGVNPDETTEADSTPVASTGTVAQAVSLSTESSVNESSSDDRTVASAAPTQAPESSIDGRVPATGGATRTGTTVSDDPSRGPGPGTSVDDSGPRSTAPNTTKRGDDDPVTTATSTPDRTGTSTPDDQSGRGGGNGGGGGGSPGGPASTP